jgi:TPR repeat protein
MNINGRLCCVVLFFCNAILPIFAWAELPDPTFPGEVDEAKLESLGHELEIKHDQFTVLSFDALRKEAERGDSIAQYMLALRCYWGEGTKVDVVQAVYWMQKSAESGYGGAQSLLAKVYLLGKDGKKVDYEEALKWASKAAMQHFGDGMATIGYMYVKGYGFKQDFIKARQWFLKGREMSSCDAMEYLAMMYFNGEGVEKDSKKAFEYAEEAAELGSKNMQYFTGRMYEEGTGVKQDYTKAYEWLLKAAKQEHAAAQYQLGVAYVNGRGIAKDEIEGIAWTLISAGNGDEDAKKAIAGLQNTIDSERLRQAQQRGEELKKQITSHTPTF